MSEEINDVTKTSGSIEQSEKKTGSFFGQLFSVLALPFLLTGIVIAADSISAGTILGRAVVAVFGCLFIFWLLKSSYFSIVSKGICGLFLVSVVVAQWDQFSDDQVFVTAINSGDLETVQELINKEEVSKSYYGINAIQKAAEAGHTKVVSYLLAQGHGPEKPLSDGEEHEAAIYYALKNGHEDVVKVIQEGSEVDVQKWIAVIEAQKAEEQRLAALEKRKKQLQSAKSSADGAAITLVKKHLKSPTSLQVASNSVVWEGFNSKGQPAFISKITYDAANSFGALIRNCKYISFAIDAEDMIRYNKNLYSESCEAPSVFGVSEKDYLDSWAQAVFK